MQGFSPSLRLAPPSASQVYFTPLTPFGFTLQGFPLPRSRTGSSPVLCRLAVIPRLRSRPLEWRDQRRTYRPLLEAGYVPLADFTALLPLRVRAVPHGS
jgi:hypothetical protein